MEETMRLNQTGLWFVFIVSVVFTVWAVNFA